jgi:hypothetical protein
MSLSNLASIGSFVSGMAVLVSLVLLFFQMRQITRQMEQTERNQQALMHQGMTNRITELSRWSAEPQMADLLSRVDDGETKFTRAELRQLQSYLNATMNSLRDTVRQHRVGLGDPGMLDAAQQAVSSILARPAFRALWKTHIATSEFRSYVDGLIVNTPLIEPIDTEARFKSNLTDVIRSGSRG